MTVSELIKMLQQRRVEHWPFRAPEGHFDRAKKGDIFKEV